MCVHVYVVGVCCEAYVCVHVYVVGVCCRRVYNIGVCVGECVSLCVLVCRCKKLVLQYGLKTNSDTLCT